MKNQGERQRNDRHDAQVPTLELQMHEEQADEGGLPHRQEQEQHELQVARDGQLEREAPARRP